MLIAKISMRCLCQNTKKIGNNTMIPHSYLPNVSLCLPSKIADETGAMSTKEFTNFGSLDMVNLPIRRISMGRVYKFRPRTVAFLPGLVLFCTEVENFLTVPGKLLTAQPIFAFYLGR